MKAQNASLDSDMCQMAISAQCEVRILNIYIYIRHKLTKRVKNLRGPSPKIMRILWESGTLLTGPVFNLKRSRFVFSWWRFTPVKLESWLKELVET